MNVKNIYQRINAIMNDCEYLQKKAAQQGKGIKYDEVIAMLRPHLINHGVVMVVNQLSFEQCGSLDGKNQKIYQGHYSMDLVNIDKPEEKVTHTAFAQGMDGGDKAAGKAHTYAMKTMLVKGFALETGEDEESRSEKLNKMSMSQAEYDELAKYCLTTIDGAITWTELGLSLSKAYGIGVLADLPKGKFKAALERCKKAAI
jgi:hypothetical protein